MTTTSTSQLRNEAASVHLSHAPRLRTRPAQARPARRLVAALIVLDDGGLVQINPAIERFAQSKIAQPVNRSDR